MAIITVGPGKDHATIQAALNAANANDEIHVYAAVYNECVDVADDGITILKVAGEAVTWNFNAVDHGVYVPNKINFLLKDFDDINATVNLTNKYAFWIQGAGGKVENVNLDMGSYSCDSACFLYDANGGHVQDTQVIGGIMAAAHASFILYSINSAFKITAERCLAQDGSQMGFNIQGNDIDVHNCIVDNPGTYGFWCQMGVPGTMVITIYNCVVYSSGNNSYHIRSSAPAQDVNVTIKNCISHSPATYHLYNEQNVDIWTSDYNVGYNAGINWGYWNGVAKTFAQWKTDTGQDANSYDADPGFTNPAGDDFTLDGLGSAVDSGVDLSAIFTDDYAGTIRTVPWDIGAYDYVAPAPPPAVPPGASIMGKKTAPNGYVCFIQQFIINTQKGLPRLKLPDGTGWS